MKEYKTAGSSASMVSRYAFSNMMADAACAAIIIGSVPLHASDDKYALMLILYNILSVAPGPLISLYADKVRNRHTGVLLGVMLIFLGFVWPYDFGMIPKIVLLGLGNAVYRAFASSSVFAHSKYRAADIGIYLAGGVMGIAIARFMQFSGFFALPLLVFAAAPSDKSDCLPEAYEERLPKAPRTDFAPTFAVLLLLSVVIFSYINFGVAYEWNTGKKVLLLIGAASAFGRFVGGYLFDRLSWIYSAASIIGGAVLIAFCPDSKLICLAGIALFNSALPSLVSLIFRCIPKNPGFSASLAAAAYYLGYAGVKLFPKLSETSENVKLIVLVGGGLILAASVIPEIVLNISGKRQMMPSEEMK